MIKLISPSVLILALSLLAISPEASAETPHLFDTVEPGKKFLFNDFYQALTADYYDKDLAAKVVNPHIVRLYRIPKPGEAGGSLFFSRVPELHTHGIESFILTDKKEEAFEVGQIFKMSPSNWKVKIKNGNKVWAGVINLVEMTEFDNNGKKDYKEKVGGIHFGYGSEITREGWDAIDGTYRWLAPLTWNYISPAEFVPDLPGKRVLYDVVPQPRD